MEENREKPVLSWQDPFAPPSAARGEDDLLQETPLPWWQQAWVRMALPGAIVALLLLAIVVTRPRSAETTALSDMEGIETLMPLAPIPAGAAVLPELLRLVPLDRKTYTRKEQLRLLRAEEAERLRGRLRAKTSLPPGKPLSWSDIVILFPRENSQQPTKNIIKFSKE